MSESRKARAASQIDGVRWLSLQTAAEYLDMSTKTLRRLIADGSLPAYRRGSRLIRVRSNDIDALLHRIPAAELGDALGDDEETS